MFQKILLATDGSEHAKKATKTTIHLAKTLSQSSIILMHVIGRGPTRSELAEANYDVRSLLTMKSQQALRSIKDEITQEGLSISIEVGLGEPAKEIIELARQQKIDLIIMGSRGLSSVEEIVLGSVSHKVIQNAPCPVMVVK